MSDPYRPDQFGNSVSAPADQYPAGGYSAPAWPAAPAPGYGPGAYAQPSPVAYPAPSGYTPQYAPQYGQPGSAPSPYSRPYGSVQHAPSSTLAVTAMVLGISALLMLLAFFPLSPFLGVAAIVCGDMARRQANRGVASGKGMAIAGVATGASAIGLCFLGFLIIVLVSTMIGF